MLPYSITLNDTVTMNITFISCKIIATNYYYLLEGIY